MSLILPQPTDKQNNPSHSKLHRVVAVDTLAAEQTIKIYLALVDIAVNLQALNLSGTNTGDETLGTILAKIGYTPENTANKATDFSVVNNTKFPTIQAAKTYMDSLVVGLLDDRGSYNASGNVFPSSGGSGSAGAILKGDLWFISGAGTLGGVAVAIGDQLRALVDSPGQTASNWAIMEGNVGYVPENTANKSTSTALGSSNTLFPTQNAVKVYVDAVAALLQPLNDALTQISAISPADGDFIKRVSGVWAKQTTLEVKRAMKRMVSYSNTATVTVDANTTSIAIIPALSQATLLQNPSGSTPENGDLLEYIITTAASQALTYGTKFRATELALITATSGSGKTDRLLFQYQATDDKWDLIDKNLPA